MRTEADLVFRVAQVQDPFAVEDPYLLALMDLPPAQRKVIAHQAVILCATIEGLDPPGALELLAQVAPYLEVKRS